ncbi:hypothetical protein BaRGS_00021288 [Batillaria attramentaria]|uniref:C2H2-type domain-containing protein n=1 Tax=Batillaria attramentaria TaxID=370345 RepID=A0ABD0KK88_9CAEN
MESPEDGNLLSSTKDDADVKVFENGGLQSSSSDITDGFMSPTAKHADAVCPCCNASFSSAEAMLDHIKTSLSKVRTYSCSTCLQEFVLKSGLQEHQQTVHGLKVQTRVMYKCDECDMEYTSPSYLFRHKNIHKEITRQLIARGVLPKPTVSNVLCGMKNKPDEERLFDIKRELEEGPPLVSRSSDCDSSTSVSMQDVPDDSFENEEQQKASGTCQERTTTKNQVSEQCQDCDVPFHTLNGLNRHRRIHFGAGRKIHTRHQTPSSFPCSEPNCSLVFPSQHSLTRHRSKFHGIDRFTSVSCPECNKKFPNKSTLAVHARMHNGRRPYKCDLCPKAFRCSSNLVLHRRVHTQDRLACSFCDKRLASPPKYSCNTCGKAFKTLYGITTHRSSLGEGGGCRGTTGKQKLMCEVCGHEFSSKVTLKSHMVTHTSDRPFKCRMCEATFRHYKSRYNHEKTHTGKKEHVCSTCGKSFYQKSNLVIHTYTHSEERNWKCKWCSKAYPSEQGLRRHEKAHIDLKPYKCSLCPADFRLAHRLTMHLNNHRRKATRGLGTATGSRGRTRRVTELPAEKSQGINDTLSSDTEDHPYKG